MNAPNFAALVREVRRLALADVAILQALELASFMLQNSIQPESGLYTGMLAGMCVTYTKPFMSANGLGSLPQSYAIFPSQTILGLTHADILDARNRIYAHRDLATSHTMFEDSTTRDDLERVGIDIHHDGSFVLFTVEPHLTSDRIREARELFTFQRERLKVELGQKLAILAGTNKYKPGSYIIGETYPTTSEELT